MRKIIFAHRSSFLFNTLCPQRLLAHRFHLGLSMETKVGYNVHELSMVSPSLFEGDSIQIIATCDADPSCEGIFIVSDPNNFTLVNQTMSITPIINSTLPVTLQLNS
jgi:hypothetical protein